MKDQLRGGIMHAYVTCALWASCYLGDMSDPDHPEHEDAPENCDDIASPDDCEPAMLATMREQCAAFLWDARAMLRPFVRRDGLAETLERAGHDLWLTAQRHGAGFWDGDWRMLAGDLRGEPDAPIDHGEALSELARAHGERGDLYVTGDYDACSVSIG